MWWDGFNLISATYSPIGWMVRLLMSVCVTSLQRQNLLADELQAFTHIHISQPRIAWADEPLHAAEPAAFTRLAASATFTGGSVQVQVQVQAVLNATAALHRDALICRVSEQRQWSGVHYRRRKSASSLAATCTTSLASCCLLMIVGSIRSVPFFFF